MAQSNVEYDPPILDERYDFSYPAGHKRLFAQQKVAGTFARIDQALVFARGRNRRVHLVAEPDNPHDANAIAVLGECLSRGVKKSGLHIGYLPADYAAGVARLGIPVEELAAHLASIWWVRNEGRDTIYIRLSISCPSTYRLPRSLDDAIRPAEGKAERRRSSKVIAGNSTGRTPKECSSRRFHLSDGAVPILVRRVASLPRRAKALAAFAIMITILVAFLTVLVIRATG